jgi:hypothetical protein
MDSLMAQNISRFFARGHCPIIKVLRKPNRKTLATWFESLALPNETVAMPLKPSKLGVGDTTRRTSRSTSWAEQSDGKKQIG